MLSTAKIRNLTFLVADTQLYIKLCPSVGPLVHWSIGLSVVIKLKSGETSLLNSCLYGSKGCSVDGGWMPLPTRPQRYCDPASLVFYVFAVFGLVWFGLVFEDQILLDMSTNPVAFFSPYTVLLEKF